MSLSTIGKNIERIRTQQGLTTKELIEKSNVGKSTLNRILRGAIKEPRVLPRIAEALDCHVGDLYSDAVSTYNLKDAPVCEDVYWLELPDSRQLGIRDFPEGPVTVEVVPYSSAPENLPIRLVYRFHGQDLALVVEVIQVGENDYLHPVGAAGSLPPELQPTTENGHVLGAIFDVVSLSHLFHRT